MKRNVKKTQFFFTFSAQKNFNSREFYQILLVLRHKK